MTKIVLRDVLESDLPIFFNYQRDKAACYMAAFTLKDPDDWEFYVSHWAKLFANNTIIMRTILFKGEVAGHIVCFGEFGEMQVGYWLGQNYWGKGIATQALAEFLKHIPIRPLFARTAKDNVGSLKVLERGGFTISGETTEFSNVRGEDVEEYILTLREA